MCRQHLITMKLCPSIALIHDIGKKECSNLAGDNVAKLTYFVLQGINWIIDFLLTDDSIKFCLIFYNIHTFPVVKLFEQE